MNYDSIIIAIGLLRVLVCASLLIMTLLGCLQSVVEKVRGDISARAAMNEIVHSYLLGFYSSEPPCHLTNTTRNMFASS